MFILAHAPVFVFADTTAVFKTATCASNPAATLNTFPLISSVLAGTAEDATQITPVPEAVALAPAPCATRIAMPIPVLIDTDWYTTIASIDADFPDGIVKENPGIVAYVTVLFVAIDASTILDDVDEDPVGPVGPVSVAAPAKPVGPVAPIPPVGPVGPVNANGSADHVFVPFPILIWAFVLSTPNSPSSRTGFAAVHSAAVPRRKLTATLGIVLNLTFGLHLIQLVVEPYTPDWLLRIQWLWL